MTRVRDKSMGDEKGFGHNSLQIWYVYFKSRAPSIFISEVVVSVFLFSLR